MRAFCRFVLPLLVPVAGTAVAGAVDLHEQRLKEATSLLQGGSTIDKVEVAPLPSDVLRSPQFASLLKTYSEDTALERALGECRLWIDVERFRANKATDHPLQPVHGVVDDGELSDSASPPQQPPGFSAGEERCASLNKRFGWSVKKSGGSLEAPSSFAVCTEAPWFADVEIVKVEEADEADELNMGSLLLHVKYSPPLPAAFPPKMPSIIPLTPFQILTPSDNDSVGPPRPGEKATIFCLEKGRPLVLSRQVEDDAPYLEFLPGPWSVRVDVELYPDVSRPMGVGVRLRLKDNVAVTLPPSRLLPFTTEGLRPEHWLLLELADLHLQKQREGEEADEQETDEMDRVELWDKMQRERASEAFSSPQCRLTRGERFGDPVQLDCSPEIIGQSRKELMMNGVDVVRRGVIGLVLAVIPSLGLNVAFHSLIRSNDNPTQRVEKAATELSLFNLKKEWKLGVTPEGWEKPEEAKEIMDIASRGWTPEQAELLDEIANEILQMYAQAGKDRTRHNTEGKITFAESDDKLVIHVPVSQLSYRRRHLLGLLYQTEAELVFTFVDRGGLFHPFHKVPNKQGNNATAKEQQGISATSEDTQPSEVTTVSVVGETDHEAGLATGKETSGQEPQNAAAQETTGQLGADSTANDITGKQLEVITANDGAQMKLEGEVGAAAVASDKPGSSNDDGEERITYLQLLWQKVGEPQHRELKRTAIANIVWDVGISAACLIMAYLTAKLMGSVNGRTMADMLRERRTRRLALLRPSEFDITATHNSESHAYEATFERNLRTEEGAAVAEGVETNSMLRRHL
ncbi:hypothetical protein, conserved [Eimeria brunetti]|uniref:Transmembrane protein n=1 Tax=Eimeria brunetti TaxID=51314 RepID=U6LNR1_9EIME|nr:hypothetical protein, conserved [Eimeria brunetti]